MSGIIDYLNQRAKEPTLAGRMARHVLASAEGRVGLSDRGPSIGVRDVPVAGAAAEAIGNIPIVGGFANSVATLPLNTLGLAYEATGTLARDAIGTVYGKTAGMPGGLGYGDNPRDAELDAIIAQAYAGGGPGAAQQAARRDPRKSVSLTAGGLELLADPSNLAGGPLAKGGRALATVRGGKRLGQAAEILDEIIGQLPMAVGEAVKARAIKTPAGQAADAFFQRLMQEGSERGNATMKQVRAAGKRLLGPELAELPAGTRNERGDAAYLAAQRALLESPPLDRPATRLDALGDWTAPRALAHLPTIEESVAASPARRAPEAPLDVTQGPADRLTPEPEVGDLPDVDAAVRRAQDLNSLVNPRALRDALGFAYNGDPTHALRNVTGGVTPERMTAPQRFAVADWVLAKINGEPEEVAKQNAVRALFGRPEKGARRGTDVATAVLPGGRGPAAPDHPAAAVAGDPGGAGAVAGPAAAPPALLTGADAYARAVDLVRTRDEGRDLQYLPLNPDWYAKRGIDPAEAPGLIRRLVDEGLVGGADEQYALLPEARGATPDVAMRQTVSQPPEPTFPGADADWTTPEGRAAYVAGQRQHEIATTGASRIPEGAPEPVDTRAAFARLKAEQAAAPAPGPLSARLAGKTPAELQAQKDAALADLYGDTGASMTAPEVVAKGDKPKPTGGGMGLTPGLPPLRTTAGAALGSLTGATAGFTQGDTLEERFQNAGKGALAGAFGGAAAPEAAPFVARIAKNLNITPEDLAAHHQAGRTAQAAAEAPGVAKASRGPGQWFDSYFAQRRSQTVATPKNLAQDVLSTRFLARVFAPGNSKLVDAMLDSLRANRDAPDDFGRAPDIVQTLAESWVGRPVLPDVSAGLIQSVADDQPVRPTGERVLNELVTAALRTRGPVSAVSAVLAPVKGKYRPYLDTFFTSANRGPQDAARYALFTFAFNRNIMDAAESFLAAQAARGVDVTPLAHRAFTPDEVRAVAGEGAAAEWSRALATIWGQAEAETRWVFGDFKTKTKLETLPIIGKAFYLSGWAQRMLPVYGAVALKHPAQTLALAGATQSSAEDLKARGLPGYLAGKTPIPGADRYIDLPGIVSPVGGSTVAPLDERQGEKNAYQRATDIVDRFGLMLHPALTDLAYVTGADYKRPTDAGRYAGLESRFGPELAGLPTYGDVVDTAREGVTGLLASQGIGKRAFAPPKPEDKRIAELFADEFGKPLAQADTLEELAWIARSLDKGGDIYRRARRDVRAKQGTQNLISVISPAQVTEITPRQEAAYAAKARIPYSRADIEKYTKLGEAELVRQMQRQNDAARREMPDAALYDSAGDYQRRALLLRRWEEGLGRTVRKGTAAYGRQRAQIRRQLGLSDEE